MILEIAIGAITAIVFYFWLLYKRVVKYFESYGVKYLPGWPIFGNAVRSTFNKEHLFYEFDRVYKAFPNERYVGYIDNTKPSFLIRDPELIKLITVKDFDHFTDHKDFFTEHIDPMLADTLIMMKGEKWRHMRTTLSPAFTGSKMKHTMQFIVDISKNILEYLKEHEAEDIDVGDLMRRYTNDVIASTSFGIEVNSLKDRDNQFFKIGQTVLSFTLRQQLILAVDEICPSLAKVLGLKVHPKSTYAFFENAIRDTMEYRKANNVTRPDMIQLMMETDIEWTPQQLCAQAFIFFVAGFETSASALTLAIHELAINPDIQEKLYQEIIAFKEANGDITNENLSSLKYLDCCLNETLRRWSPSVVLDRTCTKTYELPPASEGGKPCVLKPGHLVYNSSNSLHLDPQYWPEPLRYDPDRWSEETKHKITPFTYHPFGVGPRICIGSRFAILEVKVLLYYLVLNFKILKCAKTSDPIELHKKGFHIKTLGGTWARFEVRK